MAIHTAEEGFVREYGSSGKEKADTLIVSGGVCFQERTRTAAAQPLSELGFLGLALGRCPELPPLLHAKTGGIW